jgi:pimeloyl-ACP methyl ester carboxylesterase
MVHKEHRDSVALREVFGLMAQEVGAAGFVRQQNAIMARVDSRPTLASIHCPTLVLVGDGDELTPPARAAEIASGIAGAKLVTVKECGHLSTLEQPVEVTRALVEWLWA